jgi:hypothetical protein
MAQVRAHGPISLAKYPADTAVLYEKTMEILPKLDPVSVVK